jgi:hypothetical protein
MILRHSPQREPVAQEGRIECRTIRDLRELNTLRGIWDSWPGSRDSDLDFFSGIVESRGPGCRPHVIVLTRNGEPESALIGLREEKSLPLKLGQFTIFQCQVSVLEFVPGALRGFASKENCAVLIREVMRSLDEGEADLAVLRNLDVKSPLYDSAIQLPSFASRDHSCCLDQRWFMDFPKGLDELFMRLGRSQRSKMRRKYKKVARHFAGDARVRCFHSAANVAQAIADMEEIAQKTNKRLFGLGFFGTPQVHQQMARMAETGWLRIYILYLDGKPAAFWMGTLYHRRLQADHVGYDPAWSKFSPGVFLFLSILEDLREEEITTIDFGCGDTQLKQCFGCSADDRSLESNVRIFSPSPRGRQLNLLCTAADRATALFRQLDWLQWGRKTLRRHLARQLRKFHPTEGRKTGDHLETHEQQSLLHR